MAHSKITLYFRRRYIPPDRVLETRNAFNVPTFLCRGSKSRLNPNVRAARLK